MSNRVDGACRRPGPLRQLRMLAMCGLTLAGCASPSLAIYTMEPPAPPTEVTRLTDRPQVIEVRRVAIPDYLDTQDIVVRDGALLRRSSRGRWATRLSLGVTHYLTGLIAAAEPGALVTDQPQLQTPQDRLSISISALDVTTAGQATLEADWTIVPRDASRPVRRQRVRLTATGPVETDQQVVDLIQSVLRPLAVAIEASDLRS